MGSNFTTNGNFLGKYNLLLKIIQNGKFHGSYLLDHHYIQTQHFEINKIISQTVSPTQNSFFILLPSQSIPYIDTLRRKSYLGPGRDKNRELALPSNL